MGGKDSCLALHVVWLNPRALKICIHDDQVDQKMMSKSKLPLWNFKIQSETVFQNQSLVGEHFLIYNFFPFFFPLKSLYKKNILTNQMKNEYFQENLKKRIKSTREMILSKIPNQILEKKSKSQGKRRFFRMLFSLITSKKIFISLWYRRSPCIFTLKKWFF